MSIDNKAIAVTGSTGSIGRQTLEVAAHLGIRVAALSAGRSVLELEAQARRFLPELAVLDDEDAARDLRVRLRDTPVRVEGGTEAVCAAAAAGSADISVVAAVGLSGLRPALAAVEAGLRLALANKESLVCGGHILMQRVRERGVRLLPVDSEHSAIFQCMEANTGGPVSRILLTASGGPFFGMSARELKGVTAEDALEHPNWRMGRKITIDSATMMNKGLELIEAMWLYDVAPERIEVVIQRESIIHSMIELCDGSVIAQLAVPDMRLAIQYAVTWPERAASGVKPVDFTALRALSFAAPDEGAFPCLRLAREAAMLGGNAGALLNGANEEAVSMFLDGRIGFDAIAGCAGAALREADGVWPTLEGIFDADKLARARAREYAKKYKR